MQSARAAIVRDPSKAMAIEDVMLEAPRDDEVLVKIVATGVCHTDMVMRDGLLPVPQPVVLGHEGAGHIVALGKNVTDLALGDAVVLSFAHCGHCTQCDDHAPAYCDTWAPLNFFGARADGSTAITDAQGKAVHSHVFGQSSFATHALVQRRNVVKVEADVPLELLGPLGCGFMTGAGAVLNALQVKVGKAILIMGAGAVGLSAVMAAKIAGATTIVALDLHESRVTLAQELGATHGIVSPQLPLNTLLAEASIPHFDYILDTTGHTPLIDKAISLLGPRGEMGLVAAFAPGARVSADATHILSGGRVIRGIVEGSADPATFIPQLIGYYREGRFPIDRLVEYYAFQDILTAINDGETGKVVKPIVRMS